MAAKKTKKKAAAKSAKSVVAKKTATKTVAKKATKKKTAPKKSAPKKPKAKAPKVNQVVHWEIQARDPAKLHEFYSSVFGWKIDANNPMNYGLVESKGSDGINGGIGGSMDPSSRVVVYAEVVSIPPVLDRIASLGGTVVMPRTDIGPVIMALYQDPEGNTMGLLEPGMSN